jgi:hypothetical protein
MVMDSDDVKATADSIADSARERVSGDIAGQIFHLTQAVLLLAQVVVELPGWLAESR